MLIDDQSSIIEALSRPETYGLKSSHKVYVKETNISELFLTGEKAYKLKRGIKYPYVDYSTPEKRLLACEKEMRICDIFAPGLCLGVEKVVADRKGRVMLGKNCPEPAPEVLDYVLVMHEFTEEMLFDHMADKGDLDRFEMMDTAEAIFSAHQKAAPTMRRKGAEIISGRIQENNMMLRSFVPDIFDAEDIDALESNQLKELETNEKLLNNRCEEGQIRWCHGDLTLRNIAMWDGKVTLFNPIEFNDDLAQIDVLYDFAFLLIDMESKGLRRLASILFNHYMAFSADWEGIPALPLFLSCRAAVNAYVFAQRSVEVKDRHESNLLANKAYEHLVIARRFLDREKPILIACGGLSGSGKSRIGREVAPFVGRPPGAVILRDDVLRKNMYNMQLEEFLDESAYTPENEAKVFDKLCEECRRVLKTGQSVVADALFHDEKHRQKIEELAREMKVGFQGIWADAPLEVRVQRVASRVRNPSDVKTADVLERQLDIDVGYISWEKIDTSGERMATLAQVRTLLAKK